MHDGDNDYTRFWKYLIAACQSTLDGIGTAALELIESHQILHEQKSMLDRFNNEALTQQIDSSNRFS